MDSNAIAATMPSWRSDVSSLRVPNTIVNAASASAKYKVLSFHQSCCCGMA